MIITHLNFAKGFRGGERQTSLLIEELSLRGYIQNLIVRKNSQLTFRLSHIKKLNIIEINKPYVLNINIFKSSSILHAHETKAAQVCFFANIIFKIPYIVTRRVDNTIRNNFFNKNIYENSLFTIALSNAIKNEIQKISDNINIKIIPSAYSKLELNSEKNNNIQNTYKNKFIIGNIGELDNSHKGQYYLIEAMKKLQTSHPNIHLILLGKGKDEQKYKNQSKNLTNITFEGFVNNVVDYISVFDLFVFPSLNEGLGSILFDIMQNNVAIIATNTGGIPDIIKHNQNGILVPIKNSDEIYNAIVKLYTNKNLRNKLCKNAFLNIDNYSYEVMTNKYEKIYKGIL